MNRPEAFPEDRDELADARIAEMLRADPLPEPPAGLAAGVRRRVRLRRLRRVAGVVAAAAATVLLAVLVGWRERPQPGDPAPVAVRPDTPAPVGTSDDLPEAAVLFDPPPVDPLDHLARQQTGYVAAMRQLK
jgi:hypothetical protein